MNKGKTIIVWILIIVLLGVIGFCIYLVIDKANSVKCEEKQTNQTETCNCPKCGVKQNDDIIGDTTSEVTENVKDTGNDDLVTIFKTIIVSANSNISSSKIADIDILKIERFKADGTTVYQFPAKYKCSSGGYDCVYQSQIQDGFVPDADGYYQLDFTYLVRSDYSTSFDTMLRLSGPVQITDRVTLYEK